MNENRDNTLGSEHSDRRTTLFEIEKLKKFFKENN